jgi:hypothetical protein
MAIFLLQIFTEMPGEIWHKNSYIHIIVNATVSNPVFHKWSIEEEMSV